MAVFNEEFNLREIRPTLGGGCPNFDLVEQMDFIYVNGNGRPDSFVQVKNGELKGLTKNFENNSYPKWNQVFSILKDRIQAPNIEILVKDKARNGENDLIGLVTFEANDVPRRVPPNSPVAPSWCRLHNPTTGEMVLDAELLIAVWLGTQANEVYWRAWQLDATTINGDCVESIRSITYVLPKLSYLRVKVIEAHDLLVQTNRQQPQLFVRVALGKMILRTNTSQTQNGNPWWDEDLMFVVAEPFENELVLFVEDEVGADNSKVLGQCSISLEDVGKRKDWETQFSEWYDLEKHTSSENGQKKVEKLDSRVHLRIRFDGGYHVLMSRSSILSKWKDGYGSVEIGILNAQHLAAVKSTKDGRRGVMDAYCVAKYGQQWIRTRTIPNSYNPKWNEQYRWTVYDPCTVITIGVFDNSQLQGGNANAKDSKTGKVRILLSTFETNRVYSYAYPLIALSPSGVTKMGEIQLAVRFSCNKSFLDMLSMYTQPLLPNLHYTQPLSKHQIEILMHHTTQIISTRLSHLELPLRKEVVEYMLDVGSNMYSVRRSKANYSRIALILSALDKIIQGLDQICKWKSPYISTLVFSLFLAFLCFPWMIHFSLYFVLFTIGAWTYHLRPRHPPHIDVRLSQADIAQTDEIDEEFDTFPTSVKQFDVVKMRYDRLRAIASRVQTLFGDLAAHGERFYNLLTWRDPRAMALFMVFCSVALLVLHVFPKTMIFITACYFMRPPRFRDQLPSYPMNFLRRLPEKTDDLLP
ncbi:hypothetical protein ACJIZ3_011306 [Penstemon smallii]|uniref:C2 domain-containing protein n=1 Tax=Penstemon smallii TaxID=265156 RepID=A0ABD3UIS1_9LAMI